MMLVPLFLRDSTYIRYRLVISENKEDGAAEIDSLISKTLNPNQRGFLFIDI